MTEDSKVPSILQIAKYWQENNNIPETELNFDWGDAESHCWNCGTYKKSKSSSKIHLERCHIVPKSLGGENTADNYVLLCKECHKEAPDVKHKSAMWEWLKLNRTAISLYGTYKINKALQMLEEKDGIKIFEVIKDVGLWQRLLECEKDNLGFHGGSISVSTYYYWLKDLIEKYRILEEFAGSVAPGLNSNQKQ